MKLDFTELPVVDAHAHPFMPSREKKSIWQKIYFVF